MATVIFYEKPGCLSNARQKKQIEEAGHTVIARNLLAESWSAERLRTFFGDRPVREWFNSNAPALKAGRVRPDTLDATSALALMVEDPLLIRRPLWEIAGVRHAGFDADTVATWLGISAHATVPRDFETCAHRGQAASSSERCA